MKMVCVDDEPQFYEQVREIVSQCREEGGNVELLFYDRPEMLQYDLSEQKFYDLYLLDIEFTGSMSGLALAELIREKDQAAQILFVTSHAEYALAGYDYHPLHYILKSQMEEKLKQVLDEIVREQSDQAAQFRIFRKHSRIEKIAYREICYIYKDGKNSIYVCGDGRTYAERKPLAQIRQEIRAPQMLAIGKSYIVNLNRIERLEGQEIFFDRMVEPVYISSRQVKFVNESLYQFLRGE